MKEELAVRTRTRWWSRLEVLWLPRSLPEQMRMSLQRRPPPMALEAKD